MCKLNKGENMELDKLIDNVHGIIDGLAEDELLFNNANKPSERFPTQRDFIAGEISKYMISQEMPAKLWEAHESGKIHFHDADYGILGMTNCCLVALGSMLENGLRVGNAEISTPKSITTAAAVTAQILTQVSSHQYGGTSVDRIDEVLAVYVRKSYNKHHSFAKRWLKDDAKASVMATELTEKETYDACQALEYEINTMFNSNGQSPFITFGFGLGESWEARLVQKCILRVRMKGLGVNKRTAVFPKLVYVLKDGLNKLPGDPNYDIKQLSVECTANRMYPDYISYERVVEVTGDYKVSMGCRSFLAAVDSGETSGRMNLGVVSLNLPMIGMESRGDIGKFRLLLTERIRIALEALDWRVNRLRSVQAKQAPILYMEGAFGVKLQADEYVFKTFKDRASVSLGYIGCHEMVKAMFGENEDPRSERAVNLISYVLDTMKKAAEEHGKLRGLGYSLYATPSESLCDRFCRINTEQFPEYDFVTKRGYYTNSHHLDVELKVAPNVKFDYEQRFTRVATGGCISYVELPNMKTFLPALEWVIDDAASKVHYFGINTPVDTCEECGFMGESKASENGFECPICGNHNPETLQVTRRVCGYLGSPNARPFNPGKQLEVMGRIKHADVRAK